MQIGAQLRHLDSVKEGRIQQRISFANRRTLVIAFIAIFASGGLASMADIEALAQPECALLAGAISGRALYDGRIDAVAALARLERRS